MTSKEWLDRWHREFEDLLLAGHLKGFMLMEKGSQLRLTMMADSARIKEKLEIALREVCKEIREVQPKAENGKPEVRKP